MSCRARMTALLTLLATASAVGAQETALQFSFSNPGARSLGFGGAFVALVDDATAAFANPAGLVQLVRPEISVEGRAWDYSSTFTGGGRILGEPTGIGIDDTAELRFGESSETLSSLSFLSFVYPKGRWSLAFYRHQLANFRSFSQTDGLFLGRPGMTDRVDDRRVRLDLNVVTYGAAVGARISERLSLGLAITYNEGGLAGHDEFFTFPPGGLFLPNPYRPEDLLGVLETEIRSGEWSFAAGFLWQINDRWSLGGVYRAAPEFDISQRLVTGPALDHGIPPGTLLERFDFELSLPDLYGIGFSYRSPGEALTLSFEWDRVEYSDILESFIAGRPEEEGLVQNDGEEIHLGLEYAFLRTRPLFALRFGVWRDPDKGFRAERRGPVDTALFQPDDDEIHAAAGLGLAFERIQLDLALDLSELVDTFSLSAIYTF